MKRFILGSFLVLLILTIPAVVAFAQASKVPVIILFKEKPTDKHVNLVKSNGGEITRTYHIINGFAANVPQDRIDTIKNNPLVISVDPDVELHAFDLNADTQIRANQVWAAGDTGQGVPVAILDTGIDRTHPEFSGRIVLCNSEISTEPTCDDGNGHGTHVAGIAGAAGVNNAQATGVAPALSFYIDKVLDSSGSGTLSGVIAGIDWGVTNKAKVESMSLGTSFTTKASNCNNTFPSLTSAINNAVAAGVTVVAAAGNSGNAGVSAPGCISNVIAVGAVDSTDTIASFSSRGAAMTDHGIVAPGVNIFSTWLGGSYATLSGTSMATPHVSGTIALMLKANPSLSPTTIRSTLFNTACTSTTTPSCPTGAVPNSIYGYGRIDALAAYKAVAGPTPTPTPTPTPDFSILASPSSLTIQASASGSSTITVTSLNGFSGTVSLAASAPGLSATLSPTSLTIASGGSGSSTLSIIVSSTTAAGTYTVTVTGTSSTLSHSTAVTVTVPAAPTASLSVAVTTDKTTYPQNSWAFITVTVTANGTPVSGASVTVTVTNPIGGIAQGSGTTDANGHAAFKYRIGLNALLGAYAVNAQASATGFNPGTGSTTFNVV